MGRRRRQRAALRELQQLVWGDSYQPPQRQHRTQPSGRFRGVPAIILGAQLIGAALWLALFAPTASAHTNQISISCTQVTFAYTNFPDTAVISNESITIDRQQTQKTFTFQGPEATDTITINPGPGTHSVSATSHWSFNGQPQGAEEAHQLLSDCGPTATTTTTAHTTTTRAVTTTSTTATTSTTVSRATSTTTSPRTTTSVTMPTATSTTLHTQGSTTPTTRRVQRSTTSTTGHGQSATSSTTATSHAPLPFTGSDDRSPVYIALAMIGVGLLAAGLARRRSPHKTTNA